MLHDPHRNVLPHLLDPKRTVLVVVPGDEHHHKGIGLHTAADVHYGLATTKSDDRAKVLATARAAHPQRFTSNVPPKILALPETAWINQPDQGEQHPKQPAEPAA